MNIDFKAADVSVMVAIPVNRDMPWQVAKSLLDTVLELKDRGIVFDVQFLVGSSIVQVARSLIANTFLKTGLKRLFMIDSDQSWKASDFVQLLALSTKMPVVVGPYPAKRDPPTFLLSPIEGGSVMNEWGCVPINGHGLGFTVVSRDIVQALSNKAPTAELPGNEKPIPMIFRCDVVDGVFQGEDMAFFADVQSLGHTVYLDPSLSIGHIGAKEFKASILESMVKV